jgi:hypothetical protein
MKKKLPSRQEIANVLAFRIASFLAIIFSRYRTRQELFTNTETISMSWIASLLGGGKPQKRNSMRVLEDLYESKGIGLDDYVELKGSLLNGDFPTYRQVLSDLQKHSRPGQQHHADLDALLVKAEELVHRKELVDGQKGVEDAPAEDDDTETEEDGEEDEDESEDDADHPKEEMDERQGSLLNSGNGLDDEQHPYERSQDHLPQLVGGNNQTHSATSLYVPRYNRQRTALFKR